MCHPKNRLSGKNFQGVKVLFVCLAALFSCSVTVAQDVYFDWAKSLNRTSGDGGTQTYSVAVDAQRNVYFKGIFRNTVDLDPGPGVFNASSWWDRVFIVKLDPAGNFIWARVLEGERFIECSYLRVTPGGDLYLTGMYSGTTDFDPGSGTHLLTAAYSPGGENFDVYTLKLDKDGIFQWVHTLDEPGVSNSLGVTTDLSGNAYSTGFFQGVMDFDPGPAVFNAGVSGLRSSFVTKFSSQGNIVWVKTFSGIDPNSGFVIETDLTGNVYVSGVFDGIVDFDPGPSVYNLGSMNNQGSNYLAKLNANGDLVWAHENMGGSDFEVDAHQEIVTINRVTNNYSGALSRYDIGGNLLWTKVTGGRPPVYPWGSNQIKLDAAGNIFLTGDFYYTSDFDPGPGIYNMTATGGIYTGDAFICRLDPQGNFVWAKQFGNGFSEEPEVIALDTSGNIYTIGKYYHTVDFDPGAGQFLMSTDAGIYIHKMSRCQNVSYATLNITTCSAYTLNNHNYTQSGTYQQSVPNASGCDSIITLQLNIQNSITDVVAEACDTYTWNNQLLSTSGIYMDTLTSLAGCDSIIRLQLHIRNRSFSSINTTICEGGQYAGYINAGTYIDVFTAANGCDSIRTLNLNVIEKKYASIAAKICSGQSYLGYSSAGIYIDSLTSVQGCDSIRTLTLEVNPVYSFTINKTICQGEIYMGHSNSGVYNDRLQTFSGCDSIQTTILTVLKKPNPLLGNDTTLCRTDSLILHAGNAETYTWQDGSSREYYIVKAPGLYSVVATNSCGTASTKIFVKENTCKVYFPNAFTPNNDFKNDKFGILNAFNITHYHLTVYNRWGQLIFESENPAKAWDGTYNGKTLETSVFVWQCTFKEMDKPRQMKGSVVLIR